MPSVFMCPPCRTTLPEGYRMPADGICSLWKRDFGIFPLADARQNYISFRYTKKRRSCPLMVAINPVIAHPMLSRGNEVANRRICCGAWIRNGPKQRFGNTAIPPLSGDMQTSGERAKNDASASELIDTRVPRCRR